MIGEFENGVLDRLRQAGNGPAGVLGYAYAQLETFPDDWQSYWAENPTVAFPACWIGFAGWRPSRIGNTEEGLHVEASFGLLLASQSYRNNTAARHGDGPSEPGSFQLVRDATALLVRHRLGLEISPIEVGAAQHVNLTAAQRQAGLSIMSLTLGTSFLVPKDYFEPGLEFLSDSDDGPVEFAAVWDLPPAKARAQDIVELAPKTYPSEESL